ncbi:MAG TPA: hypothetical protein VEL74_00860 [Thermoanaerobaculia bacterium]|nr:hypothetical protein [Thermoanaerobaculia bacterium]
MAPKPLLVLLCAGLLSLGAAPAPSPSPGLPVGAEPLPAALERRVDELVRQTESIRGLRLARPVLRGVLEEEAVRRTLAEKIGQELPPEDLRSFELALEAFGLIPGNLDLATYLPKLLSEEVAGFYDPEGKYLVLVRRAGQGADETDDSVLVHELAHAIQDQHFRLDVYTDFDPLSDEGTARSAVVEGDAMWVMLRSIAGSDAAFDRLAGALSKDPEVLVSQAAIGPGALAGAPPFLRESLLFSYLQGLTFCLRVKELGGRELLDRAFTTDPPRSSEQILHPEKWAVKELRDDPVPVPVPDVGDALPGWTRAAEGQLGEMGIAVLLRGSAGERSTAEGAAAGWGGDRFAVYTRGEAPGRRLLIWSTEWDSEAEAAEFRSVAAARLGAGWEVRSPAASPSRRVLVIRGDLDEAERGRVRSALDAPVAGATPPPAAPSQGR